MTITRNTPASRGLAVGLLLAVVTAIYGLIVLPVLTRHADNQQRLERLARELAQYEQIAQSRSDVEQLLESMRPQDDVRGYYLTGSTRALASAELQAYARSIIEASQGSLVSTQPVVKGEREPDRLVKVNVRMSGTIESLLQVFYRITNGVPVLLADEVLIRRTASTLSRLEEVQRDDALDVQFTLTGFVKESVL